MRGATIDIDLTDWGDDISIHAPHAGRDGTIKPVLASLIISIHAPHAGRDYDGQND